MEDCNSAISIDASGEEYDEEDGGGEWRDSPNVFDGARSYEADGGCEAPEPYDSPDCMPREGA